MASADDFEITVRGRGGHASMPHHAADPIPIACEIVTALQAMVTRRVDAFDPAVVTVAKIRAGTTTNVIPETATLWGTIRTVSASTRERGDRRHRARRPGHRRRPRRHRRGGGQRRLPGHGQPRRRRDLRPRHGAARLLGDAAVVEMPTPGDGRRGLELRAARRSTGRWRSSAPGRRASPPTTSRPTTPTGWCIDEDAMAAGIATYTGVALRWLRRRRRPT